MTFSNSRLNCLQFISMTRSLVEVEWIRKYILDEHFTSVNVTLIRLISFSRMLNYSNSAKASFSIESLSTRNWWIEMLNFHGFIICRMVKSWSAVVKLLRENMPGFKLFELRIWLRKGLRPVCVYDSILSIRLLIHKHTNCNCQEFLWMNRESH